MKLNRIIPLTGLFLIITLFLTSCFDINENNNRTKNKQDTINIDNETVNIESESIEIELPFLLDFTDYMIFPISINIPQKNRKLLSGSSDSYYTESETYRYNSSFDFDSYYGNFVNLMFKNINNKQINYLTKENIRIISFHFLRNIYSKYGKQYIILEIKDTDTNHDGMLDYQDISALYICTVSGNNLKKLSLDGQHLNAWKVISRTGELYFQTTEEIDDDEKNNKIVITKLYCVDLLNNFKTEEILIK